MRSMVLVFATTIALAACGSGSNDTGLSENDTSAQTDVAAGANSFTEDQARNRLITLGYAAPTTMTMTESGAWRAVTRDPAGNAVTVLVDYRGNVSADPTAQGAGASGTTGTAGSSGSGGTAGTIVPRSSGSSGSGTNNSGSNAGPGQSSPAPSGGSGQTPSNPR